MENTMREFSKDDWDGFAGAESDEVMGGPLIGEREDSDAVIVVDKNGIQVFFAC